MTEKEAMTAIEDFFTQVPRNVADRVELEAWARLNPMDAVEAFKAYAQQRQEEERKEALKVPDGEIYLAEDYFSDEQKVRLVAAMHPNGKYANGNPYGITKADEQLTQLLWENIDERGYEWEVSLAMLEACFRYVRENPAADPWLMESVHEWDAWVRNTIYIVSQDHDKETYGGR